MSSTRNAYAELKAALKTELQNTSAERVITMLSDAMGELVREDLEELTFYWADGRKRTLELARSTGEWG